MQSKQASVTGLEGVVAADTAIGYVNGSEGLLVYRGQWAKDLAVSRSFEEAAYLLWRGRLPDAGELRALSARLAACRQLTPQLREVLDAIPRDASPMSAVMAATAAMAAENGGDRWPPEEEHALRIVGLLPVMIAYRYHRLNGTSWPGESEEARTASEAGHVAHYLYLLFARPASPAHIRAMNAYMILAMEHGLNASTFAARVVASTESDLYSAVAAAIGAMKGPLHGGAPSGVIQLLEDIGTKERAEPHMRAMLGNGERLMGFGHRIYKTRDPRAEALREVTAAVGGEDPWLDLARHVETTAVRLLEEYKPGRRLFTNVEFYAAAVMRALNMPPLLFTPTFTAARAVGWTAHVLEQAGCNRIFRPQSAYVGPMPDRE